MILTTHAVFGAAVASLVPDHPIIGFTLGFASHFVLDAIPHKDYELISIESDSKSKIQLINILQKKFSLLRDIIFVSLDALVGFILAFLFFFNPAYPWIFFVGAFGSLIPDGMTFLYLIFKNKSLAAFYHFHSGYIHSRYILKLNQFVGVIFQFVTVVVLIIIMYLIKAYTF